MNDLQRLALAAGLAAAGAAIAFDGEDLDEARLSEVITGLLSDRSRLKAMSKAARSLANPGAAAHIAEALVAAGGAG